MECSAHVLRRCDWPSACSRVCCSYFYFQISTHNFVVVVTNEVSPSLTCDVLSVWFEDSILNLNCLWVYSHVLSPYSRDDERFAIAHHHALQCPSTCRTPSATEASATLRLCACQISLPTTAPAASVPRHHSPSRSLLSAGKTLQVKCVEQPCVVVVYVMCQIPLVD